MCDIDFPGQSLNNNLTCSILAAAIQGAVVADCDFDNGVLCDTLRQVTGSDNFDWSIGRGSTGTSNTGPSGDRTTGGGEYDAL